MGTTPSTRLNYCQRDGNRAVGAVVELDLQEWRRCGAAVNFFRIERANSIPPKALGSRRY